ncbi:MAG: Uma2 family endonuclease [Gemmatimonadales bacterium]
MPELAKIWTREEVLALPDDGNRYELVDGELLVSPTPRPLHQLAVSAFYDRVKAYVRANRLGTVLFSPADLDLRAGQLLQPDLFVLATEPGRPFREWTEAGIPRLVVEVLSPSTARYDRITKRRRYQRSQVPAYWIVDLDARLVEVWKPMSESPVLVDEVLTWQPDETVPALRIDLPACFREIWGEAPNPS